MSHQLMRAGYQATVGYIALQFWAALLLVAGLAYHALYSGKLIYRTFIAVQLTVGALLFLVWLCLRNVFHWQWIAGYVLAMAVFAVAYILRERIRSTRVLDHLANISYPLYVIHALLGYAVMYWMISYGVEAYTAIFVAGFVVYILSVLLHFGIEKPFIHKRPAITQPKNAIIASPV